MMGMMLLIKLCVSMMDAISTDISVDSQLGLGRKMVEGWKRGSNTPGIN